MNCQEYKIRKKNPRDGINWLSLITFFFAFKIFRKFHKDSVKEKDVYEIRPSFSSENLGNKFERKWRSENYQFLKTLVKMFWKNLTYWGLSLTIIETSVMIIYPLLLGKLVSFFTPGQTEIVLNTAVLYSLELVALSIFYTFYIQAYFLYVNEIGLKVKIAACSLIYRKCLKLNLSGLDKSINGLIVTIMTKDVHNIERAVDIVIVNASGFFQMFVMVYMMYNEIGPASFTGCCMLVVIIPIQVYLGKLIASHRLKTATKTDQRVKVTQEILTAIRIIKMYTWELFFSKSVSKLRRNEIRNLKILFYLKSGVYSIGQLSSRIGFYVIVITYIAFGNHVTAEKAFIVTACFGSVRAVLNSYIPAAVALLGDLRASLHRINNFLTLEEVKGIENFESTSEIGISVKNITLKSTNEVILNDLHFDFSKGLALIMGPMGSGKSTLLKVILGDVPGINGKINVRGKVSYASQEPWLFPSTVRQNIIFGEQFDKNRYLKVVEICALKKDIDSLPDGDKTLVTDRGLNLSKGQKARINLARAVYKQADIYLLDDPLSSVDSCVGNYIFKKCIKTFLKNRLCILVTHQPHFTTSADYLLVLNKGCVQFCGSYESYKNVNNNTLKEVSGYDEEIVETSNQKATYDSLNNGINDSSELSHLLQTPSEKRDNIYQETNQVGGVNKKVYYDYFFFAGGFKVFAMVILAFIALQTASSLCDYFVSFWVDMEQELTQFRLNQTTNSSEYLKLEESHDMVMKGYSFVMLAATILTFFCSFVFFIFSSKASTNIHNAVLDKILNSKISFFDKNLSGNVLNRFTRDLGIIDDYMPISIFECIAMIVQVIAVFFVVSSVNLYFIVPSIIFTVVLLIARRFYMPTGRNLRRLEGATRSPVIGHLNATLEGLTTIRASRAQDKLRKEFDKHQDLYNSLVYINIVTIRAFAFYLDLCACCYIAVITLTFIFFKTDALAGKVGLAITQSFTLTGILQWGIRTWSELENQMTSTERVLEYKEIEQEDTSGTKVENWPSKGSITYKNVNLIYVAHSERVLKDLSFNVLPQEKIGIVGRTGAGKTSIISTLLRMYDYTGTITIDNVDIKTVSIHCLRSKISIIPQDPNLFSGTVRSNLDPYSEYSDEDLWNALRQVEIAHTIKTLNQEISEGSSDFSIGERQLFCLARAVVRNNSILVLDEATANIDSQTDVLIQRTIKKLFSHCTVITIAHKLNTILDSDRVMVMNFGEIVQFGPPEVLLENKLGPFYQMVKESGLL